MRQFLGAFLCGLGWLMLVSCQSNPPAAPELETASARTPGVSVAPASSTPTSATLATATARPISTQAAPLVTIVPTPNIQPAEVLCPSDNDEAIDLYNDGTSLAADGKTEQAIAAFLQAIELDPGYCDAMDNLGLALRRQGEIEEAIKWYERSLQIKPDNVVAHVNLAVAYSLQGETDKALEEYQLLVKIAPDDPEGYYGLGTTYLSLQRPAEAIPYLKKAEELYAQTASPWIVDARFQLGFAYFRSKDYQQALDYLKLVYAQMPDDPEVNYLLGLCYLAPQTEDVAQAKEYLSKARDLGRTLSPELLQLLNK